MLEVLADVLRERLPVLLGQAFVPGIDDLVFAGFAQSTPTLFPFVESQARLVGAYAVGRYRLPEPQRMREVIVADQQRYTGHMLDRPRHTQQVDYFLYEHDMRTRELPAGAERARVHGPPSWARVADTDTTTVGAPR